MTADTSIQAIEAILEELLKETEDVFLVSLRIKPINNIKIFLDAESGMTIEKCIRINRKLYKIIEEKQWWPDGDFSLEVSSAGIDEPLKLLRQYKKNTGRKLEVTLNDERKKEGKLLEVTDEAIRIEEKEGKGKKLTITETEISFADIKQAKVLVEF